MIRAVTYTSQHLLAGLYTWIISIFFGAVLLDIVYFNIASSLLKPAETAGMFSQAADFLLLVGMLTVLAAIGAIGSSWGFGSVRNLFIASIVVVIAIELLTPLLFSSLVQSAGLSLGFSLGPWIRVIGGALSSILAFLGLWKLFTSTA